MMSYLICFGVFTLIVVLTLYLTHESEFLKDKKNRVVHSVNALKGCSNGKIANGPILCVKSPGEMEYKQIPVYQRSVKIGSQDNSDVVLRDEFVEPVHAIVRKIVKNDQFFYELVNLSKYNPVQWFNQMTNSYEELRFRQGVILDSQEVFYIGETKMIVICPVVIREPSKTERLVLSRRQEDATESEVISSSGATYDLEPSQSMKMGPASEATKHYECSKRVTANVNVG